MYLELNLFHGHIKGFLTSFNNKAPCIFLSKAQYCETAGCNIKARSIPPTYKITLPTNKQAERMGSVWLRGEEDEGRGEKRKWSFVGEALRGFFLPRCQATEH